MELLAQLFNGDPVQAALACRQFERRFTALSICRAPKTPEEQKDMAHLTAAVVASCTLFKESGVDPKHLVELAEIAVRVDANLSDALGAALYRAGKHQDAVKLGSLRGPWSVFYRAMAHQRLNQPKEAKLTFQRSGKMPNEYDQPTVFNLLRAEAARELGHEE